MKRNSIFAGLTFLLLLALPAQSLEIVNFEDVDGETFYLGDFVDLGTVLLNDGNSTLDFLVEQYVLRPGINPMPLYEEFSIGPGGDVMISDMSFEVSTHLFPGEYTYMIRAYSEVELLGEKTKTFQVRGTMQRFSQVDVVVCADSGCGDVRPFFVSGETAYINVDIPENPKIMGDVENSWGGSEKIEFTEGIAEFTPASPGTYTARITVSKSGFLTEILEKDIVFTSEEERSGIGLGYVMAVIVAIVLLVLIMSALLLSKRRTVGAQLSTSV